MKYSKIDEIRFWSKVNVSGQNKGCWYWESSRHTFGYGYFRINKKTYLAHKLALIFWNNGNEEEGLQVLHSCDNPACCNPKHLRWGTPKDNIYDAIERGSHKKPPVYRGESHPKAKLTWENVDTIRKMRSENVPVKKIAEQYLVAPKTIYSVISFRNWGKDPRKGGTV
jgi:hypothetical protein